MPLGICGIASYLPEQVLSNDDLVRLHGFDLDFLNDKLGIHERHIACGDEACSDCACAAAERLFDSCPNLDPAGIDLLILCTQNPDYRLPHTSAIVQSRLGLPKRVAAFDVNLGCSGFVYSLAIATSLMQASGMRNGIIITSDQYSNIIDPHDRATAPLFGDAACAVWLAPTTGNSIGKFTFGTNGDGHDRLILRSGGTRRPPAVTNDTGATHEPAATLQMDGRAIFEFMMKTVPPDVRKCLQLNQLTMDDVDYFLFHQASAFMLGCLRDAMKLPEAKVPILLRDTGNTVSSSIPLALRWLIDGERQRDANVLLSGFGVGLSWASTVITFT